MLQINFKSMTGIDINSIYTLKWEEEYKKCMQTPNLEKKD
jgi:hypothetical protein